MSQAAANPVRRQISLPLSKAVEIAWQSIRMRLGRSLLVTSAIVLALAFLVSIQAGEAITGGMRAWIAGSESSPHFAGLRKQRDALEADVVPLRQSIRAFSENAQPPAGGVVPFDPQPAYGADFAEIQRRTGPLPATPTELTNALTDAPEHQESFKLYLDKAQKLAAVRSELDAPDRLASDLRGHGVAMTPAEIAAGRTQSRWLLGLALLVAFVGILNAMLMSVTERFREIGTMKCLGALDGFIVKLFLLESLFQGIVGTTLGIALGLGLSLLLAGATYGALAFAHLPWGEILVALAISFGVGTGLTVLGAVYPAWQAARMQPIEAMRSEA